MQVNIFEQFANSVIITPIGVFVKVPFTADETNAQTRNKSVVAILAKLNSYNYEVIVSIAKMLLDLQSGKVK